MQPRFVAKILLCTITLAALSAHAATLPVTITADSGPGSLRTQLSLASSGDTIVFQLGLPAVISLTSAPITISTSVTITGPGADNLVVDGNFNRRIFIVDDASATLQSVTISGLGFRRGNSFAGNGGGILNSENLTLQSCVFNNCNSNTTASGGGVHQQTPGATLTVRGTTINGSISGTGAGISVIDGTLVMSDSTLINCNAAASGGGIAIQGTSTASVTNSTIRNNLGIQRGGGIAVLAGTATLSNCTLSDNSSTGANGGGGAFISGGTLTITNSTLSSNTSSTGDGAGVAQTGGTLTLRSTIVAGNTRNGGANDVSGAVAAASDFNLIGVNTNLSGITNGTNSNQIGTAGAPINPLLEPFGVNGGPTETRRLKSGSPAIGAGSNPAGLTTDQRGTGFPRLVDSTVDAGALEFDGTGPLGSLSSAPAVNDASNATQYDFAVTFSDNTGVAVSTLDGNDVRVTGPAGFSVLATFVSVDNNTNGTPRVATYRISPPGGSWDSADNGTYTISLEAGQVRDASGNNNVAATLGTFTVARTAPTAPPPPGDADNDGFSDAIETTLGSNPAGGASTPFGLPRPAPAAGGLSITTLRVQKRKLRMNGEITDAAGLAITGKAIIFTINGLIRGFAVDGSGRSVRVAGDFFQFSKVRKGTTTSGKFTLVLRNGDYSAVSGTANVSVIFNGRRYSATAGGKQAE